MDTSPLIGLASIIVLGIAAQWIAWRIRLPSILLLLLFGFIAGPALNIINPDALLGDSLFPAVSMAVAVILFEGGLTLKFSEFREVGRVVQLLNTVGVLVTWIIGTLAAWLLVGLSFQMAALLGAILVVSGPTVVMPLLRFVRPATRVSSILKWEGILVDPIGATLAVLVFESIVSGEFGRLSLLPMLGNLIITLVVGSALGAAAAGILIVVMQRHWIPHRLDAAVALMLLLASFALSNTLVEESGLMAATIMGVLLANQSRVNLKHVVAFDEELGILLLSGLFIMLAARLDFADLASIGPGAIALLLVLIVVARPISVFMSTLGSDLSWREKAFLAWLFPRGIVAASVASLFALELSHLGYEEANQLVPITFLIVVGTVAVYAITAIPVAKWLGVTQENAQGTLILGAHAWARDLAKTIEDAGLEAFLVDINHHNIRAARQMELKAFEGNALSDDLLDELPFERIGRLFAVTQNNELNSLVTLRYSEILGAENVYQLTTSTTNEEEVGEDYRGHVLFDSRMDFDRFTDWYEHGATFKRTNITEQYSLADFQERYGIAAQPLFLINKKGEMTVAIDGKELPATVNNWIVAYVHPDPEMVINGRAVTLSLAESDS